MTLDQDFRPASYDGTGSPAHPALRRPTSVRNRLIGRRRFPAWGRGSRARLLLAALSLPNSRSWDGGPPFTPFVAGSDGPPSAGPVVARPAEDELVALWGSSCLHGEIATGFSLTNFEGGSVEELETCARSQRVAALYVLHDGDWVSFILGAPDFVNQSFVELYADSLPRVTSLVAKSDLAARGERRQWRRDGKLAGHLSASAGAEYRRVCPPDGVRRANPAQSAPYT